MADYVSLNLTPAARDRLRTLAFVLTGATGRRVTLSDALAAACAVAEQYPDAAKLAASMGTPPGPTHPPSHRLDPPTTEPNGETQ